MSVVDLLPAFCQQHDLPARVYDKTAFAKETFTPGASEFLWTISRAIRLRSLRAVTDDPRYTYAQRAAYLDLRRNVGSFADAFRPLFWFYHGQLDRMWARWQVRCPANVRPFYSGRVQDLARYDEFPTGVGPMVNTQMTLPSSAMEEKDIRIEAVMSITSEYKNKFTGYEGVILCYTYNKM